MKLLPKFLRRQPRPLIALCGHATTRKGTITVNGQTQEIQNQEEIPGYCLACVEKLSTSCSTCKQPILPDTPVWSDQNRIVCPNCLEMGCIDCTGQWTTKGYEVVPFEKLYE